MKSDIIPFASARNVAPASDEAVIALALEDAISEFGAENLAMTLVEFDHTKVKMAA